MFKLTIFSLSIIVCIFALPHKIREQRDTSKSDAISFPQDSPLGNEQKPVVDGEAAPAGNGTDLDSRFLGVGIGLGYALGQKLLGGHHHGGGEFYLNF